MPQTTPAETPKNIRTFGDNGETISEIEAEETPSPEAYAEGGDNPAESDDSDGAGVDGISGERSKYRIGDKTSATQEEALAYAQSQVSTLETEKQLADAYRQGIRDAVSSNAPIESVTPPPAEPEFNSEEYYADPATFLSKFAHKIKSETQAEFNARMAQQAADEQVWREFTDRHPSLADFRQEVESFASKNKTEVYSVVTTKGKPAAYDFIATKLRAQFARYAAATKPQKMLPNAGTNSAPLDTVPAVTPKKPPQKPMTFAEQIRSIKKNKR